MEPIQYVTVPCPRCNKRHRVVPKILGRSTKCKRCRKKFELRPVEAEPPHSGEAFDLSAPSDEKEFYIPVSLTSNPMIDRKFDQELRAQTSFIKKTERGSSKVQSGLLFLAIFFCISSIAFLAYWFLLRN